MPWIILTVDHVYQSLAEPELAALRELLLMPSQVDPLPEILDRTSQEVRGYVAAWHGQQVGQPGTVPNELLTSAISIARWRLIGRLPVKIFATEFRRKEYDDALHQLELVAAGKFLVSIPEDPDPEQPLPPAGGEYGSKPDIFA